MFGYVLLCLAMFGYVWLCLAMSGYVWLSLAMFGYLWLCLAMFGLQLVEEDEARAVGPGPLEERGERTFRPPNLRTNQLLNLHSDEIEACHEWRVTSDE